VSHVEAKDGEHSVHAAATRERDRAFGLGPFRAGAALLFAVAALSGCGGSGSKYPSYLPKNTLNPSVDAVLSGTMARPALTVEGLAVAVRTRRFNVLITVGGPVVPGEGLPYQPDATTCTWTVTMKSATADVPVSLADFHVVDHLGSVAVPELVPGETPPPRVLHPGQVLTFRLRAYELVGQGMMQWAPDHRHVVAIWDYSVEND
jgi:hypothetical protein